MTSIKKNPLPILNNQLHSRAQVHAFAITAATFVIIRKKIQKVVDDVRTRKKTLTLNSTTSGRLRKRK